MSAVLRRSLAATLAAPLLALALYAVFSRGTPWRGEWAWTIDWASGSMFLVAPVVAGCAAFEVVRWHGATDGLLDATVRPRRARLVPLVAALAVAVLVYAVVLAVAIVLTVLAGAVPEADVRVVVLALGCLVAAGGLGALLGRLWPSPFAAPLAVALVFALGLLPPATAFPPLFRVAGTTGSLVGLTTGSAFFAWVLAADVLLAAACVAWLVARGRRDRAVAGVASVLAVTVAVGCAVVAPPRLVESTGPVRYACAGTRPQVCLARQTSRLTEGLPGQLAARARLLRDAGLRPPSVVRQVVPGREVRDGAPLYLDRPNRERLDGPEADAVLTYPASCAADRGAVPPPDAVFAARDTIAAWLGLRAGTLHRGDLAGRDDAAFLGRSESEQEPWLRATYRQLSDCAFDAVRPAS